VKLVHLVGFITNKNPVHYKQHQGQCQDLNKMFTPKENFKPPEWNSTSMTSFLSISQRPLVSFQQYSVLNVPG